MSQGLTLQELAQVISSRWERNNQSFGDAGYVMNLTESVWGQKLVSEKRWRGENDINAAVMYQSLKKIKDLHKPPNIYWTLLFLWKSLGQRRKQSQGLSTYIWVKTTESQKANKFTWKHLCWRTVCRVVGEETAQFKDYLRSYGRIYDCSFGGGTVQGGLIAHNQCWGHNWLPWIAGQRQP